VIRELVKGVQEKLELEITIENFQKEMINLGEQVYYKNKAI